MKLLPKQWKQYKKHLIDHPNTIKCVWTSLYDRKSYFFNYKISPKPSFEGFMQYLEENHEEKPSERQAVENITEMMQTQAYILDVGRRIYRNVLNGTTHMRDIDNYEYACLQMYKMHLD